MPSSRFLISIIITLAAVAVSPSAASTAALPTPARTRTPPSTLFDGLLRHLFIGYKRNAMPICAASITTNSSSTSSPASHHQQQLQVYQDLLLYQLYDLDETTQTLSVDVWLESSWRDCRLVWLPATFNNVSEFAIKSSSLWYPDLVLYESLHGNVEEGTFVYAEATARVRSDGWVRLGAQALLRVFCRVRLASFPYDRQRCNLTFASWSARPGSLALRLKPSDSRRSDDDDDGRDDHAFRLAGNGEWQVVGFPSYQRHPAASASSYEVVFQLRLRRKPLFYTVYLMLPCMLITWLAGLAFALPAECGEKVAFSTTLLLSLVVFLMAVADNVPRSGDSVPLLGVYFLLSVSLVAMATCMVISAYNVALRRPEFSRPRWLVRGCGRVGRIVGGYPARRHMRMSSQAASEAPPESSEASQADANADGTTSELDSWRQLGAILDRLFCLAYLACNLAVTAWFLVAAAAAA